jgi:hypothetical protein
MEIDTEFQNLIEPLTDEEYSRLEENILKDGLLNELIVWEGKDILIDGHHRHKICEEHNIPLKCMNMPFKSRDHAMIWMIDQQGGRRNITPNQKSYLIGKRYDLEKKVHGTNQYANKNGVVKVTTPKTSEQIAADYNVSEKTVRLNADYAIGVDHLANESDTPIRTKKNLLSNKPKVTKEKVKKVGAAVRKGEKNPIGKLSENTCSPENLATTAIQIVVTAISHLDRIMPNDPKRNDAFDKVIAWIDKHR